MRYPGSNRRLISLSRCGFGLLTCSHAIFLSLAKGVDGSLPFDISTVSLFRDALLWVTLSWANRRAGWRGDGPDGARRRNLKIDPYVAIFWLVASTLDLGSLVSLSPTSYLILRHSRVVFAALAAPVFVIDRGVGGKGLGMLVAGCGFIVLDQILGQGEVNVDGNLAVTLAAGLFCLAGWGGGDQAGKIPSNIVPGGWRVIRVTPSICAWSVAFGLAARVVACGPSSLYLLFRGYNLPGGLAVWSLTMAELVLIFSPMRSEQMPVVLASNGVGIVLSAVLAGGLALEETTGALVLAIIFMSTGAFLLLQWGEIVCQPCDKASALSQSTPSTEHQRGDRRPVAIALLGFVLGGAGLLYLCVRRADMCYNYPVSIAPAASMLDGGVAHGQDVQHCLRVKDICLRMSWSAVSRADQDWWFDAKCEDVLQAQELKQAGQSVSSPHKCKWMHPDKRREQTFVHNLHGRYANKTCVLVANGPSLNAMQWDWQETFDGPIMGMNKVYLALQRYSIRLDLYAAVNDLVIDQSVGQIWGLLPSQTLKWLSDKKRAKFPCKGVLGRNIMYFKASGSLQKPYFSYDISEVINTGWTVTYVSLQILHYVGCKTVIIVGMDHHFEQVGKSGEAQIMKGRDPNHFDPTYFVNNTWQLAGLNQSERSYRIAREEFEKSGRTIIDASVGGHCTVFDKGDYKKLLYPSNMV